MFQNELALKQIDRSGAFAVDLWEKLTKLKESPYFARIDLLLCLPKGQDHKFIPACSEDLPVGHA